MGEVLHFSEKVGAADCVIGIRPRELEKECTE